MYWNEMGPEIKPLFNLKECDLEALEALGGLVQELLLGQQVTLPLKVSRDLTIKRLWDIHCFEGC